MGDRKKTYRLFCYIDQATHEKAKAAADELGLPLSAWLRIKIKQSVGTLTLVPLPKERAKA